jgi:hypothetical protein
MPLESFFDLGVGLGLEADGGDGAADFVVAGGAVDVFFEDGDVVDELEGGKRSVEAGLLGHVAQPPAYRDPVGGASGWPAEELDGAAVGGGDGGKDAQQGGLAGAVGAQQPGDAGAELEVDAAERSHGAVVFDQLVHAEESRSGADASSLVVVVGSAQCCHCSVSTSVTASPSRSSMARASPAPCGLHMIAWLVSRPGRTFP